MCTKAAPRQRALQLLENPCPCGIAVDGALWLQAARRGRQTVGVLELPREVRAVRKPRFVGDVGNRAVGILDEPIRVTHAQLPVERGRTHAYVLPAQALQLPRGQAELP